MPPITGLPPKDASLFTKFACRFIRPAIPKVTGRVTEAMLEPLGLYTLVPPPRRPSDRR